MSNEIAVVTGAAGAGIGSAVGERLLARGMHVVLTDSHERRCKQQVDRFSEHGDRVIGIPMDVSDRSEVAKVLGNVTERFGRIDILVNNAGWNKIEPVSEIAYETWHRCIDTNLNGTFNCMREALPGMIERRKGIVVNISSAAAWESTADDGVAYPAAKAGILGLTRAVAAEVGPFGVRVNAVAPGLIYNEFLQRIYPDDFFEKASKETPLGRLGTPADVAALVSFLASEDASFITGEVYGISGGQSPHG